MLSVWLLTGCRINYDDHLDEGSQYTKLELGENSVQNKTVILEILATVSSYNAYR